MTISVGLGCDTITINECLAKTALERQILRAELGIEKAKTVLEKKVDNLFLRVGMWKDKGEVTMHIKDIMWTNLPPIAETAGIDFPTIIAYTERVIEIGKRFCQ